MTQTMSSPNLQLPQRPRSASRAGGGGWAIGFLLLLVLALQVWSLTRRPASPSPSSADSSGDPDVTKQVAMKLEDRNLPEAAAATWEAYLAGVHLPAADEAALWFRVGKLRQNAKRYQDAIGHYYRAEHLLGAESGDLGRQITLNVRECLQKLGQFSDLKRETAERAGAGSGEASLQGRQIVAEIGEEKISVADFDRMLTEHIDQAVAAQAGVAEDHAEELRRQAHARFSDAAARQEQLQQMVASRVLADEARQRKLEESPLFRRQLADVADRLLASQLIVEEIGRRATVTPEDVERYYEANKKLYQIPGEITLGQIVCESEESAKTTIAELQDGADFADLAKQRSRDPATKDKRGVLSQTILDDTPYVPGFGKNAELHAAILAAAKDAVLVVPYKSDAGWHVLKIVERKDRRQKPLDEVKDDVMSDTRDARRTEVTQQYIQELFTAKGVKFHPAAFNIGAPQSAAPVASPSANPKDHE